MFSKCDLFFLVGAAAVCSSWIAPDYKSKGAYALEVDDEAEVQGHKQYVVLICVFFCIYYFKLIEKYAAQWIVRLIQTCYNS